MYRSICTYDLQIKYIRHLQVCAHEFYWCVFVIKNTEIENRVVDTVEEGDETNWESGMKHMHYHT